MRRLGPLALVVLLGACASPRSLPTVDDLRARVVADPNDAEALRDLGARLALDEEYGPALGSLDRALRLEPNHGETTYLLGLVHEAMGRPAEAEDAYARYLNVPETDAYRDSLRGRLDVLVRARLRQEFASALATEDSVTSVPGTGAVGVLPFAYRGADEQYTALGRGLAEVLAVDLASIGGLTVVERARLQALLAEYELARQGVLDAATAPRAGRLLQADRLVGGEVDVQGEALRIESALWDGALRDVETTEGDVTDLFTVQRTITMQTLASLGIDVPEAEQARLLEAPTDDLLAFLLFSRALLLEDDGDILGAERLYGEALARDPSFALASRRQSDVRLRASGAVPPEGPLTLVATSTLDLVAAAAPDLVRQRAEALQATLRGHIVPGSETREPGVEGGQAGALGALPDPPQPPPSGNR